MHKEQSHITKEVFKPLIIKFGMYDKTEVHMKYDKSTAVSYLPDVLAAAVAQYLRSSTVYCHWCHNSGMVQIDESYLKSFKSEQNVTNGVCIKICVPQSTYHSNVVDSRHQRSIFRLEKTVILMVLYKLL